MLFNYVFNVLVVKNLSKMHYFALLPWERRILHYYSVLVIVIVSRVLSDSIARARNCKYFVNIDDVENWFKCISWKLCF